MQREISGDWAFSGHSRRGETEGNEARANRLKPLSRTVPNRTAGTTGPPGRVCGLEHRVSKYWDGSLYICSLQPHLLIRKITHINLLVISTQMQNSSETHHRGHLDDFWGSSAVSSLAIL